MQYPLAILSRGVLVAAWIANVGVAQGAMSGVGATQSTQAPLVHSTTTGSSSGPAARPVPPLRTPGPALTGDTISLDATAIDPEGVSPILGTGASRNDSNFCTAPMVDTADATGFGAPVISGC